MHSTIAIDVAAPAGLRLRPRPRRRALGAAAPPLRPVAGARAPRRTARSSSTSSPPAARRRPRARAAGHLAVPDLDRAGDAAAALRPRRRGDEGDGRDLADRADGGRLPRLDRARLPAARSPLFAAFVDRVFTRPIAGRTLATFKALAEALAPSPDPRARRILAMTDRRRDLDHRDRRHHGRSGPGATRSGPGCGPAARRSSASTGSTRSPFRSQVAAQVDDFDPLAWMPPKTARQLDRFSQFGLVAGRLALDDAGPDARASTARRTRSGSGSTSARRSAASPTPRSSTSATSRRGIRQVAPEPRARRLRRRGAGQPRDRARRPRADPVDRQLVRVGRGRARRGARATCARAGSTPRSPAAARSR